MAKPTKSKPEVETASDKTEMPKQTAPGAATDPAPVGKTEPEKADEASVAPTVPASKPDPAPKAPPKAPIAPPAPAPRRGSFIPTVFGGVVAAGLGAGAMWYAAPRPQPVAPVDPTPLIAPLQADLDAKTAQIEALEAELAKLRTDAATADFVTSGLGDLSGRLDEVQADVRSGAEAAQADLDARLSALEKRPVDGGAASATALDAFEREMAEMRALLDQSRSESQSAAGVIEAAAAEAESQIAAATAEAERLKAEAALSGRKAAAQAALSHLKAAFASNLPTEAALVDLEANGVTLPEGLADTLAAAPSMADLTAAYPAAARRALAASLRASSQDAGTMDKIGAFLRSQTGARSLEPRAGDDPDAVLSRAEAAVEVGNLAAALTELAALPDVGRAAVADWSASAQARLDAQAAIDGLSPTLE